MKTNTYKAICYNCKKEIFGLKNRFGGTFYKTSLNGDYHVNDCPGFQNEIQNDNLSLYIKKLNRSITNWGQV